MHDTTAHRPLTNVWLVPVASSSQLMSWARCPVTGDIPLVSCPGHTPSQLLVPLLSGRVQEAEKSLRQDKCC